MSNKIHNVEWSITDQKRNHEIIVSWYLQEIFSRFPNVKCEIFIPCWLLRPTMIKYWNFHSSEQCKRIEPLKFPQGNLLVATILQNQLAISWYLLHGLSLFAYNTQAQKTKREDIRTYAHLMLLFAVWPFSCRTTYGSLVPCNQREVRRSKLLEKGWGGL
jgi:hypothetical protein